MEKVEPSGMTCFIPIDKKTTKLDLELTIQSCMGSLIDEWLLVGNGAYFEGIYIQKQPYTKVASFSHAINCMKKKNKWYLILYPGEEIAGDLAKLMVLIYRQNEYKIISLSIMDEINGILDKKSTMRKIRMIQKPVSPFKLYDYDSQFFMFPTPSYIKKVVTTHETENFKQTQRFISM